jgi:hypothetical protein
MIKFLKDLNYAFLSAIAIILLIACNSDDSDNKSGNDNPSSNKRITKIVVETDDSTIRETSIKYDYQGRIEETVLKVISSTTPDRTMITRYQYGETLIIKKEEHIGDWSIDPRYNSPSSHNYTLSNGLIVKDTEIQDNVPIYILYTYDNNGYIDYCKGYEGVISDPYLLRMYSYDFEWTDGNLTEIYFLGRPFSHSYSNTPWIKGMIFDVLIADHYFHDLYLASQGYYGKMPQMLPSRSGGLNHEYTVTNGLVTKVVSSLTEDGKSRTWVTHITWE